MPLALTCLTAARPTVARGWAESFRGVAIEKVGQKLRKGPGRWPLLAVLQLKTLQRGHAEPPIPILLEPNRRKLPKFRSFHPKPLVAATLASRHVSNNELTDSSL